MTRETILCHWALRDSFVFTSNRWAAKITAFHLAWARSLWWIPKWCLGLYDRHRSGWPSLHWRVEWRYVESSCTENWGLAYFSVYFGFRLCRITPGTWTFKATTILSVSPPFSKSETIFILLKQSAHEAVIVVIVCVLSVKLDQGYDKQKAADFVVIS